MLPIDRTPREDQTQFITEKPLFDDRTPWPSAEETAATKKPLFKQKKVLALIPLAILLLVLVGLMLTRRGSQSQTPEETPQTEEQARAKGPLEQRVDNLQLELQVADPANQLLPFPSVDLQIGLD